MVPPTAGAFAAMLSGCRLACAERSPPVLPWEDGFTGTDKVPRHCGGINKALPMLAAVKAHRASLVA